MSSYLNAARVLPQELLKQVRDAVGGRGCFLWIPDGKSGQRLERNRYIMQLFQEGCSVPEIADRLLISERTVWRVLSQARAAGASSAADVAEKKC